MPIYEYKCRRCTHQFDKLVLGRDQNTKIECPKCHSHEVNRLFSLFGFSSGTSSRTSSSSGAACHTCTSHNCSTCGS